MNGVFWLTFLSGVFFGVWPLVMRASGLGAAWVAIMLALGSGLVGISVFKGTAFPSLNGLLIGLAAGLLNGFGVLAYGKLIGMPEVEMSKIVPLLVVLIGAVGVLGGYFFYGEPFTLRKIIGIIAVIIAAFLLT